MVPLCSLEEECRMLLTSNTWIIRVLHISWPTSYNRKISYCDNVWHNRRNAPKFWSYSPERKKLDTVSIDHSNITALCWKDKRWRYITHICIWGEFFVWIVECSEIPRRSKLCHTRTMLIQVTGLLKALA
jgi:hypothetical protein